MTHDDDLLGRSTDALAALCEAAAGHGGLMPSVLDLATGRMADALPPALAGQRENDRSFPGSNLSHDLATLHALRHLGPALGRPDLTAAADAYLRRFATRCTDTPTGLFPWGEHSFWNLVEDRPGNGFILKRRAAPITHDHLLQAPAWLWRALWSLDAACVVRFCRGLDGHWRADVPGEPPEYNRHALLFDPRPPAREPRSCDFPRHGGFYVLDWSAAHALGGPDDLLGRVERMVGYWWDKRDKRDVLQIESRSPPTEVGMYRVNSPGQTLSLGVSLLESAELLAATAPRLASTLRDRGAAYVGGFLSAPHDLAAGRVVHGLHRDTGAIVSEARLWGSRYGSHPAGSHGLLCLRAHASLGDGRLVDVARAIGRAYAARPMPANEVCPAKDAGLALGLLCELSVVTGEQSWLDAARRLAGQIVPAYLDRRLPRAATGAGWYESQTLPGHLLYGLARVALLRDGVDPARLPADLTCR